MDWICSQVRLLLHHHPTAMPVGQDATPKQAGAVRHLYSPLEPQPRCFPGFAGRPWKLPYTYWHWICTNTAIRALSTQPQKAYLTAAVLKSYRIRQCYKLGERKKKKVIPTKLVRNHREKECGFGWLMGRISKTGVGRAESKERELSGNWKPCIYTIVSLGKSQTETLWKPSYKE